MSDAANCLVQKLWSCFHVLRDDGLSYQDYLEQLTFLLLVKMAGERRGLTEDGRSRRLLPPMGSIELEQENHAARAHGGLAPDAGQDGAQDLPGMRRRAPGDPR